MDEPRITGINHITFSVTDIARSITFYRDALGARLLVQGERMAYFDLFGLWLALNLETSVDRRGAATDYTHIAFSIDKEDYPKFVNKLTGLGLSFDTGRRHDEEEGLSLYLRDPDGHLLELHTGSLIDRIRHYRSSEPGLSFSEWRRPISKNKSYYSTPLPEFSQNSL